MVNTFDCEFEVLERGRVDGETKDHRHWERVRLIGYAIDSFGHRLMCTADMAFGGRETYESKAGDRVVLRLAGLSTRGALMEITFSDVAEFPKESPRELKQK